MRMRNLGLLACLAVFACADTPESGPTPAQDDTPTSAIAQSAIAQAATKPAAADGNETICGDKICNGFETTNSCPQDCGTRCGDAACNGDESADSCNEDCVARDDKPFEGTVMEEGEGWQLKMLTGSAQDPVTGEARSFKGAYWFVRAKSLDAAPLPSEIKKDLSILVEDPETTVTVSDEIVKEIERSIEQGHPTRALEDIAEKESARTQRQPGAGTFGCSNKYNTYAKSVSITTPLSFGTNPGSGFSGSFAVSGSAYLDGTGEVEIGIKRFGNWGICVPYAVFFSHAHVYGGAVINGSTSVNGSASYSNAWDWEIAKPSLGGISFWLGPIPVYVGFNLPINIGLDLQASVSGNVTYNSTQAMTGAFDYTCTTGGCWGNHSFTQNGPSPAQPFTGSINGRIQPSVWAQVGLRGYLYDEWVAYAQLGVRPYLRADLWGYAGNGCGDANGDGANETVSALTLDLDLQFYLTGQASVFNNTPTKWNDIWHSNRYHLAFWDIIGSTALAPMFGGLQASAIGVNRAYTARMRPCYPYTDNVNYVFNWGDSTTSSANSPAQTAVTRNHIWNTAGTKIGTLTAVNDAHGRTFNRTLARSFSVATDPCPLNATWLGVSYDAVFDGANCYVANVPPNDGSPFMWDNKYYVTRGPNNVCEYGAFDGANCYLGQPPSGRTGFLWSNAFYYEP